MSYTLRRPRALTWLLIAGIGLVCATGALQLAKGESNPPLFDGVGFPDEPYRYVAPPAGAVKTKVPEGTTLTKPTLGDKSNPVMELSTIEKGPQITASFRVGLLQASPTAKQITVALEPITPQAAPPNGTILGNAYSIRFTADDGKPVELADAGRYYVTMRIPQGTREAVALEVFHDGAWETLRTTQTGADVYAANVSVQGDLAPVLVTSGDTSLAAAAGSGGSGGLIIALVVGLCVVVGVVVFTIRTRQLRDAALAQPPGDQVSNDVGSSGSSN